MKLLLLPLAALLVVGCVNPIEPAPTGAISGLVALSEGSSSGAEVWLSGTKVRTAASSSGSFLLTKVPVGNYLLSAALPGYGTSSRMVSVTKDNESAAGTLSLAPLTAAEQSMALTETDGSRAWGYSPLTGSNDPRIVNLSYTVPVGGADVYYLLTNTLTSSTTVLAGTGPVASRSLDLSSSVASDAHDVLRQKAAALWASSSTARALGQQSPAPGTYALGNHTSFMDAYWEKSRASTLRKIVVNGGHSLYVWVSDDAWANGAGKPTTPSTGLKYGVTQPMVDALADRFLSSGTEDIYHWVTGIYGEEWPASGPPAGNDGKFIDSGGQIHIFLVNLNPKGTSKGTLMGYFYSGNNGLKSLIGNSGSNEKVLFALDANSLANPSDSTGGSQTWAITDEWPAEIVSTLSHEFQHMIHFYQKNVTFNVGPTDTWIDEMTSQVTEDLVADKLGLPGPRGRVEMDAGGPHREEGRFPLFNYSHELIPLTAWNYGNPLPAYSNSYAFGAWLVRNYGGPELMQNIVARKETDYQAVVKAVQDVSDSGATWPSLVRDWGLATFLGAGGNRQGLNYATEGGAFNWTYHTIGFKAGSINPWNYRLVDSTGQDNDGPWVYRDGVLNSGRAVGAGATYFHSIGRQSAGDYAVKVALPASVVLTLVLEP